MGGVGNVVGGGVGGVMSRGVGGRAGGKVGGVGGAVVGGGEGRMVGGDGGLDLTLRLKEKVGKEKQLSFQSLLLILLYFNLLGVTKKLSDDNGVNIFIGC